MARIHRLSIQLANMIAAGEVIERPSSVVKELLENAIDANATRIEILIEGAGRRLIEVRDDGIGMAKDDLILAIERHATSKLIDETQLFRIQTLGFRGEALPSIASVSQTRIESCDGQTPGYALDVVEQAKTLTPHARSRGTTVLVKDLFYNTPARLKYLKNDVIESSSILDVITRAACANPHIAWSVVMDGKRVISTDGRGDMLNAVVSLMGASYGRDVMPFSFETPDVAVQGYIGKPSLAKTHRYGIMLAVNGRSVYMSKLHQAIIEAYKPFLPPVRFPFVVLNMTIDSSLLDVNVHPAKRDIRFSKEATLIPVLIATIQTHLQQNNLAPMPVFNETTYGSTSSFAEPDIDPTSEQLTLDFSKVLPSRPQLTVLGVIDATYVLCQDAINGYYVIDQHAAHERVHYEEQLRYLSEGRYTQQPLIPLLVDLAVADKKRVTQSLLDQLASVGVHLEWFGDQTLKVNLIPTWALSIGQTYVEDLIHQCLEEPLLDPDKLRLYAIASKACKRSIRAHDVVDHVSLTVLIDRLFQCEYPYACPHGRPTMIHYGIAQLEKVFQRTGF
jgi:DNA mismatch repair protein MutL